MILVPEISRLPPREYLERYGKEIIPDIYEAVNDAGVKLPDECKYKCVAMDEYIDLPTNKKWFNYIS